jgi:hypothetical protein
MDATRLDRLARSLSRTLPRRSVSALFSAVGLGVFSVRPADLEAKKKKKKPLQFNSFGCVDVGGKCRGNDANCCSNICEGKKPKKGEKDKSRCVAHGQSTCVAGQREDFCGGDDVGCLTDQGLEGRCDTTTGNAGYCTVDGECSPCKKDKDCQNIAELGPEIGASAACILCAGCPETGGTACVVGFET